MHNASKPLVTSGRSSAGSSESEAPSGGGPRWRWDKTALIVALFVASGIGAAADAYPSPGAPVGQEDGSALSAVPNVIVPHTGELAPPQESSDAIADAVARDRVLDDAIELTDVGEVVAIPESAQKGMIPEERQLDETAVVGLGPDGKFNRKTTGPLTAYYVAKDKHILIVGVDELVEAAGETTKRPILIVTRWVTVQRTATGEHIAKKEFKPHERFYIAFKTVKPGQSGIEAGMKLRGGVKAVTEGVKPGTYDVYLETALPGDHGKKVLVCGTFDEEEIPSVRNGTNRGEGSKPPDGKLLTNQDGQ